ncbi:VOC family protein [uncultured Microbacterium sp.]|uniref:VOC family protein n=1 Tax=uncultured Microbacterium sp. TaxID=191216 RepID=UPI0035CC44E6
MKIVTVSVRVRNIAEATAFYAEVLGLPIGRNHRLGAVTIGATRLELVEDAASEGHHHFAITIPSNKFLQAKTWLQERTDLIGAPDADEFECSPLWNARSVYFNGPDGAVLEFIVRRDLSNATAGPFTSADLLCVSEVGVAMPDVPATVAKLHSDAQVAPYGDSFDSFAPVGDADGLLILVAPGRAWFPTADRVVRESPVAIAAVGARPGTYALGPDCLLTVLR